MKYLFVATLLLFSFCSFGQIPDSTWKVDTVQRILLNPVGLDSFPYNKLSPAMRRFIDTLICKHIYVAVEQPEVKVTRPPNMQIGIYIPPPTGKQDGQEIVCVKCFHVRKQIIDYGEPMPFGLTMPLHLDTLKLVGGKQLTLPMGGILVDTVSIKK